VKCFGTGCGVGPFGPIDLVRNVLEIELYRAALWIAEHFEVQFKAKGKHLSQPFDPSYRTGFEDPLELLVNSGLWARLPVSAQRLVPVLLSLARKDEGERRLRASYAMLRRYTGIGSDSGIRKGLVALSEINWLEAPQNPKTSVIRETSEYLITPDSDELREFANESARQQRSEIETEREMRNTRRKRRQEKLSSEGRRSGGWFT
jgi:hypothetical protein